MFILFWAPSDSDEIRKQEVPSIAHARVLMGYNNVLWDWWHITDKQGNILEEHDSYE